MPSARYLPIVHDDGLDRQPSVTKTGRSISRLFGRRQERRKSPDEEFKRTVNEMLDKYAFSEKEHVTSGRNAYVAKGKTDWSIVRKNRIATVRTSSTGGKMEKSSGTSGSTRLQPPVRDSPDPRRKQLSRIRSSQRKSEDLQKSSSRRTLHSIGEDGDVELHVVESNCLTEFQDERSFNITQSLDVTPGDGITPSASENKAVNNRNNKSNSLENISSSFSVSDSIDQSLSIEKDCDVFELPNSTTGTPEEKERLTATVDDDLAEAYMPSRKRSPTSVTDFFGESPSWRIESCEHEDKEAQHAASSSSVSLEDFTSLVKISVESTVKGASKTLQDITQIDGGTSEKGSCEAVHGPESTQISYSLDHVRSVLADRVADFVGNDSVASQGKHSTGTAVLAWGKEQLSRSSTDASRAITDVLASCSCPNPSVLYEKNFLVGKNERADYDDECSEERPRPFRRRHSGRRPDHLSRKDEWKGREIQFDPNDVFSVGELTDFGFQDERSAPGRV